MNARFLVILPTYNEKENIKTRITAISSYFPEMSILVVDDDSPDETAAVVKMMINRKQNIDLHLLSRSNKTGLGSAYREGFKWAIENKFDWIIQMDSDGSHSEMDLSKMLEFIKRDVVPDLIIGSRWIPEGNVELWSPKRIILSKSANYISRKLLGYEVRDSTSGFRIYSRKTLLEIGFESTKSQGYAFQIEMTLRCSMFHKQILEVPINFRDRDLGQSKMNYRIVIETFFLLIRWWLVNLNQKVKIVAVREK